MNGTLSRTAVSILADGLLTSAAPPPGIGDFARDIQRIFEASCGRDQCLVQIV